MRIKQTKGASAFHRLKRPFFSLLFGIVAFTASACPICNSDTGKEVRQSIFGENFVRNVAKTLAPVPLLLGAVAAVHFGFRPRHSNNQTNYERKN
jgi:hypothetical protein